MSSSSGASSYHSKPASAMALHAQTLWAAALEVWAHQLLYVRRVYPQDTFAAVPYAGLTVCKVCRHPQVVSYIREFCHAAVPTTLLPDTTTNANSKTYESHVSNTNAHPVIALKIVERDEETEMIAHEWETYTLRVRPCEWDALDDMLQQQSKSNLSTKTNSKKAPPSSSSSSLKQSQRSMAFQTTKSVSDSTRAKAAAMPSVTQQDLLRQLEDGLRQLILKTHSNLQHGHIATPPSGSLDRLSFELTLQTDDDISSSSLLAQGLEEGRWSDVSSTTTTENNVARVIRPLHVVDTALCRVDFNLRRTKVVPAGSIKSSTALRKSSSDETTPSRLSNSTKQIPKKRRKSETSLPTQPPKSQLTMKPPPGVEDHEMITIDDDD